MDTFVLLAFCCCCCHWFIRDAIDGQAKSRILLKPRDRAMNRADTGNEQSAHFTLSHRARHRAFQFIEHTLLNSRHKSRVISGSESKPIESDEHPEIEADPMWNRQKRKNRTKNPEAVGTEAAALKNMERNSRNFRYPPGGFVTPVEHSLLYSMLSAPEVFPTEVLKDTIDKEDFSEYLPVNQKDKKADTEEPVVCSYAQLSALLALSAENWPPPSEERPSRKRDSKKEGSNDIAQILCKRLIQCVVRHAEEHKLDREEEVHELFEPIRLLSLRENDKKVCALVLPSYIGMGASMLTANPLPLVIGTSVTNALSVRAIAKDAPKNSNLMQMAETTNRMADVETSGLLDEGEQF